MLISFIGRLLNSKRFRFWRETDEMTKTCGRDENIAFWRILTKFAKFLLSDKRSNNAFLAATFFEAYLIFIRRSTQFRMAKKRNLGFVAKFSKKWLHFSTNEKISGNQKPRKCFGKIFIKLANNSYNYALLKSLIFGQRNAGFWGKIFDKICILTNEK